MLLNQLKRINSLDNFSINLYKIPSNEFLMTEETVHELNELFKQITLGEKDEPLIKGTFTKSGGLHIQDFNSQIWIKEKKTGIQIILRTGIGEDENVMYDYNIKIGSNKKDTNEMSGLTAFTKFIRKVEKNNAIEAFLSDQLTEEQGLKEKDEIEKPYITLADAEIGETYKHAHHIDLNSAFMSGIALKYNYLYDTIKEIYDKRKVDTDNKLVLTHTYGFMQSEYLNHVQSYKINKYGYSHMAREAWRFTNRYLEDLADKLDEQHFIILSTNTDGIWYYRKDGAMYHDENEGKDLGQWKHDHIDCTIRYKSKGAYEFIENNVYTPVVRGTTKLDAHKSRENWTWGDIFDESAKQIKFSFIYEPNKIMKINMIEDEGDE